MLFLRGLVLGVAIAAPVGPIGLLCIRQTLSSGWQAGFLTGLGAATADGVYGAIAAFGLTAVSSLFVDYQLALRLVGGAFLLYLGIKTARSPVATQAATANSLTLVQHYATAVGLTLTNPATILAFLAIFAGLGFDSSPDNALANLRLVLGVFTGSALWWLLLSSSVSWLRHRLSDRSVQWINRSAGVIIGGFGVLAIASTIPGLSP